MAMAAEGFLSRDHMPGSNRHFVSTDDPVGAFSTQLEQLHALSPSGHNVRSGSSRWARFRAPSAPVNSASSIPHASLTSPSMRDQPSLSAINTFTVEMNSPRLPVMPASPASRPINDFDSDAGSEAFGPLPGSPGTLNLPSMGSFALGPQASLPAIATGSMNFPHSSSTGTLARQQPHHSMSSHVPSSSHHHQTAANSSRDLVSLSHAGPLAMHADNPNRHSIDRPGASRFRNDLMLARTSLHPMERYKALTRLLSGLRRDMQTAKQGTPLKPAELASAHPELLWRIIEVGEALAVIGSADYGERNNSARAINAKDFAYLLRLYGENFWAIYRQDFIDGLPQPMQDDALSVRGLLITRFEANAIIQDQLIKHVGLEGQGGGQGAVVYNTSVVNANPVNQLMSKPVTTMQTYAAAASKAIQNSNNRAAAIAIGAAAGLFLIKRTGLLGFIPGMGRPRRRNDDLVSDEPGGHRRSRRGGSDRLSADERLLLAFDHVDRSYKELIKAQRNEDLLRADWRLGPVRLSAPFGGPDPPGFQALDLATCEPRSFMHKQLGSGF